MSGTSEHTPSQNWLRRLLSICLEFPRIVAVILAASVGTVAAVVAGPLLTREGVNGAMDGETSALWWLGAGLVMIAAFDFLGDYLRRFGAGRLSLWVQHTLRSRVFDSIQRLDGPAQDSLRTGQVVSRTNNDLQQVQQMLQMIPVPAAVLTYYVLGIAVMLWLSPSLTLIAVTVIGALGLTAWRTRKKVFAASSKAQQDVGEVTEHIRSTISGISVVKSFAQETRQIRWLEDVCRRLFARRMTTMGTQAAPGATMLALPSAGQAVLLLVGGWQVMNGHIDFGTFIAFSTYLGMLTGPTRVFASFLVIAQRTRTCAERIFELIDARPEMHDGDREPPDSAGISFEGITFGYTSDRPVLHDVSFSVAPGETVAVVGASGSGKSTLALLAPRFYDVSDGTVRLGDPGGDQARDLRELRLESLRRQVGVVFEEPFIFRATIRENIAYGHDDADDAAVRAAAAASGADEFIQRMAHGYHTEVSEGGRSLSGGQRQRIALARALLTRPSVLVVDDATSAVDATTEAGINEALRSYAKAEADAPRSTLLIARRRSTLALADRIVVLDGGRTVAVGTQQELQQNSRHFRELLAGDQEAIDQPGDAQDLWPTGINEDGSAHSAVERDHSRSWEDTGSRFGRWLTQLPRAAHDKAASSRTTRVLQLLAPVKGVFGVALALIAVSALANVLLPVLVQRGIDTGVSVGDYGAVTVCAALAGLLVCVGWFTQAGQMLTSSKGSEAVQYGVRVRSFRHVLGFGLPFFEREQGGQVITRLTVDVDSLARFLQNGLAQGVMSLATIVGIGVAMLIFDPVLALIALSPLPLIAVATVIFRRLSSRAYDKAREDIGEVNSSLHENISGLRTVQSHGKQAGAAAFFRRISDKYRMSREKAQRYIALYFPFVVFCSQLSNALVMVAGAHFVAAGRLTPGVLAAFLLFLGQFYAPLQQLANIFDSYQQARIGQQRTDHLLSTPQDEPQDEGWDQSQEELQEPGEARAVQPLTLQGSISLRGLGYTHQGAQTPALRGVDLELPGGRSLAVVGTTGAGKTTLVKVLAGLYVPAEGSLTVNGRDVSELLSHAQARTAYRRGVGLVPQEPHLFDSTVAENIRFPRPEATDADVEQAAQDAGALYAIARLRDGFQHRITDAGTNLAAGQRQLIALARAYLAGAEVLLLDEATAHLDTQSEAEVMRAVSDGGRTTVVVAHRLTTAARCDRIAVMEHGRVVEHGTHHQLLESGGAYAGLWASSSSAPMKTTA